MSAILKTAACHRWKLGCGLTPNQQINNLDLTLTLTLTWKAQHPNFTKYRLHGIKKLAANTETRSPTQQGGNAWSLNE